MKEASAKQCNWVVTCVLKEDDSGSTIWKLTISNKFHYHPLAPNPLVYIQQTVAQAVEHRHAGLSYNTSLHLRTGEGFQLNSKAYYNAKRSSGVKVTAEERIDRMLCQAVS